MDSPKTAQVSRLLENESPPHGAVELHFLQTLVDLQAVSVHFPRAVAQKHPAVGAFRQARASVLEGPGLTVPHRIPGAIARTRVLARIDLRGGPINILESMAWCDVFRRT